MSFHKIFSCNSGIEQYNIHYICSRSVSLDSMLPYLHLHRSPCWVTSSVQLSQPRLVCKYVTRCCRGQRGMGSYTSLSTRGNSCCKHSVMGCLCLVSTGIVRCAIGSPWSPVSVSPDFCRGLPRERTGWRVAGGGQGRAQI